MRLTKKDVADYLADPDKKEALASELNEAVNQGFESFLSEQEIWLNDDKAKLLYPYFCYGFLANRIADDLEKNDDLDSCDVDKIIPLLNEIIPPWDVTKRSF